MWTPVYHNREHDGRLINAQRRKFLTEAGSSLDSGKMFPFLILYISTLLTAASLSHGYHLTFGITCAKWDSLTLAPVWCDAFGKGEVQLLSCFPANMNTCACLPQSCARTFVSVVLCSVGNRWECQVSPEPPHSQVLWGLLQVWDCCSCCQQHSVTIPDPGWQSQSHRVHKLLL